MSRFPATESSTACTFWEPTQASMLKGTMHLVVQHILSTRSHVSSIYTGIYISITILECLVGKWLDFLSCLKKFCLSSENLLQFSGSVQETQEINLDAITKNENVVKTLWLGCNPFMGIMWVVKVILAQAWITPECLPINPGSMWHLGITWNQVCMRIKPTGQGSQDSFVGCRQNGVLVNPPCLENVSPNGHRRLILLLFQTISLFCPEHLHWRPFS